MTKPANVRTGRVITGLLTAFFLFDSITKVIQVPAVLEASGKLGFSPAATAGIGVLLLVCLATYLVPRTAVLGAVLLTGYLGGAMCAQVLGHAPAFSYAFVAGFGVLVWLGLYLRDERVAALIAPRAARVAVSRQAECAPSL